MLFTDDGMRSNFADLVALDQVEGDTGTVWRNAGCKEWSSVGLVEVEGERGVAFV